MLDALLIGALLADALVLFADHRAQLLDRDRLNASLRGLGLSRLVYRLVFVGGLLFNLLLQSGDISLRLYHVRVIAGIARLERNQIILQLVQLLLQRLSLRIAGTSLRGLPRLQLLVEHVLRVSLFLVSAVKVFGHAS